MYKSILASALLVAGTLAHAADITEQETNNSIDAAQSLSIDGSARVLGAIGDAGSDMDFYQFSGTQGDVVDIDIDYGTQGNGSVDTILTVFGPNMEVLRVIDDTSSVDSGSLSLLDARIDKFTLPSTATYTVAVSSYPTFFTDGGVPYNAMTMGGIRGGAKEGYTSGDYQMNISGVTVNRVKQVSIKVKPGNQKIVRFNPKSKGDIPVALLSGPDFIPMDIDVDSLTFGATGNERSFHRCNWVGSDINNDGFVDRICHFRARAANISAGDTEGVLKGRTNDGKRFEGRAYLRIIP